MLSRIALNVATAALLLTIGLQPARAEEATKGPEVSTVGIGPYFGPLPEELAKLDQPTENPTETQPPQVKEPAVQTVTWSGGNALTVEELAKLEGLLATPTTPIVPELPKLEPMQVPVEGTPELTAEELEKRARELSAPRSGR